MAPLVKAGLMTDAANAGPPVVDTSCNREGHYSEDHREGDTKETLNEAFRSLTSLRGTKI